MSPPVKLRTIWLRRDGMRAMKLVNADGRYIGEMLVNTASGRACLLAMLLGLREQGYELVRGEAKEPLTEEGIRELVR